MCDGFTGNVALKSMEGTARLVRHFLREEFGRGLYGRIAGLVAMPVLRSLAGKLDPRRYNGASFVGLDGIVIKSHGGTDAEGFATAVELGYSMARNRLLETINQDVTEYYRTHRVGREAEVAPAEVM